MENVKKKLRTKGYRCECDNHEKGRIDCGGKLPDDDYNFFSKISRCSTLIILINCSNRKYLGKTLEEYGECLLVENELEREK